MIILYHGTSSKNIQKINSEGLKNPFLTNSLEIAEYYAECSCDEIGGQLSILQVEVDEEFLRYDGAAMDEPVLANKLNRDEQWNLAKRLNPHWIKNGYLCIPSCEYKYSLEGVQSVFYEGIINSFKELQIK